MIRQPASTKSTLGDQVSKTKSIPAPVFGLNTRDSIADMDARFAVILDNFFPTRSQVILRGGSTDYATGITGQVETVVSYKSPTTTKLFAANASAIYDATSSGAVGAAVQSALSNGRWQTTIFSTGSGTTYLYMVNGADKPRLYDGSAWVAVDAASTPAITGVTTTSLIHVNVFKTRLWFVEKNTLKVWYLPTNSIGGAANSLDFGSIFTKGGYLMAMGTWTLDGGNGMDDHAVFVTSEGEIAVYRGTDPSSSTTWSLVGVYAVGAPVGRRCMHKYGGDLLIICRDGIMPLSKALISSRTAAQIALTDNISPTISELITAYGANFGWEITAFPDGNMVLLNVPTVLGYQVQYAMNTITGAWCRFTKWAANTFELHNDNLYYGGNGVVVRAYSGVSDNGTNIVGAALSSFAYFGNTGQLKAWKMLRPVITTNGSPGILLGINTDFNLSAPAGIPSFTSGGTGVWDTAIWDSALWGGGADVKKDWQSAYGLGYCAATYLIVATNSATFSWAATDFVYESAGII